MMLNIKILELDEIFWKYIPVGLLISSCFLVQLFFFVFDFNVLDVLSLFFYDRIYQLMSIEMISKAKALSEFGIMPGIDKYSFTNKFFRGPGLSFIPALEDFDRFV